MPNGEGHFQIWVDDIEGDWLNELGLNLGDYLGFGEEQLTRLIADITERTAGRRVTISYTSNLPYKYLKRIRFV
jgi:hypothetical protein